MSNPLPISSVLLRLGCQLGGGYPTGEPPDSAGDRSLDGLRMVPGLGFDAPSSSRSGHFQTTVSYTRALIDPGRGPEGSGFLGAVPDSPPSLFLPFLFLGPTLPHSAMGCGTLEGMRLGWSLVVMSLGLWTVRIPHYNIPLPWWVSSLVALTTVILL